jgi:hypothetical protein
VIDALEEIHKDDIKRTDDRKTEVDAELSKYFAETYPQPPADSK